MRLSTFNSPSAIFELMWYSVGRPGSPDGRQGALLSTKTATAEEADWRRESTFILHVKDRHAACPAQKSTKRSHNVCVCLYLQCWERYSDPIVHLSSSSTSKSHALHHLVKVQKKKINMYLQV